MPARRKSLAELEANGSLAKNPGRYAGRTDAPAPRGPLGKAPRHMSAEQQAVWREIVSQAPEGVFTSYDRIALEVLVHMMIMLRAGKLTKQSELVSFFNSLGKYGLTSDGRAGLSLPEPAKAKSETTVKDELDELDELDD